MATEPTYEEGLFDAFKQRVNPGYRAEKRQQHVAEIQAAKAARAGLDVVTESLIVDLAHNGNENALRIIEETRAAQAQNVALADKSDEELADLAAAVAHAQAAQQKPDDGAPLYYREDGAAIYGNEDEQPAPDEDEWGFWS